jgi:hypothetical protein
MPSVALAASIVVSVLAPERTARAGTVWTQQAELTLNDGASGDTFGDSVALSGNTAIVAAPVKTIGSHIAQGAAYAYLLNGTHWAQQAELTAGDGAAYDNFGHSVAISGNTAILGAPGKNGRGAAYVFSFGGTSWIQQAELTAGDGATGDLYGLSVAISGNTAIVGNRRSSRGAAYVYSFDGATWSQQAELTASDGASGDNFGFSVGISGNTAIVGANWKTVGSNVQQGAAYVYSLNGSSWIQQAELTASDGAANDTFGFSVAISGNAAIVGAQASNASRGAAYVYSLAGATWTQQTKLTASDGNTNDLFGWSVAMAGNAAIVGAEGKTVGANPGQGGAYVYAFDGAHWVQQAALVASDGSSSDTAGGSVAISGNEAVMGARLKTVGANSEQGAAYAYSAATVTTPVPALPRSALCALFALLAAGGALAIRRGPGSVRGAAG